MPPIPFQYYVLAFKEYVLSDAALEDETESASAADSFLNLIVARLREDPHSVAPVWAELLPAVTFVATRQERYDADVAIYGSFKDRFDRIIEVAERSGT